MKKYLPGLVLGLILLSIPVKASFTNISAAMQPVISAATTLQALIQLLPAANLQKGALAVGTGAGAASCVERVDSGELM